MEDEFKTVEKIEFQNLETDNNDDNVNSIVQNSIRKHTIVAFNLKYALLFIFAIGMSAYMLYTSILQYVISGGMSSVFSNGLTDSELYWRIYGAVDSAIFLILSIIMLAVYSKELDPKRMNVLYYLNKAILIDIIVNVIVLIAFTLLKFGNPFFVPLIFFMLAKVILYLFSYKLLHPKESQVKVNHIADN